MKNRLIIIRGPLGVGKTTISWELANILGLHHISLDKVMKDHKIGQDGDISLEEYLKINKIILPEIRKELSNNRSVVVDHSFYYKEQLEDLQSRFDDPLIVTLKGSLNTCLKRDSTREKVYGSAAARAVHGLVNKFDMGHVINTDRKDVHAVVAEVLDIIGV